MEPNGDRPQWPDELGALRERLAVIFDRVGYRSVVGAELRDWGLGWATVQATPGAAATNLAGTVHGGVIASLADLAFEVACNSYGRLSVATELALHYAAAAVPGVPLRADAVELTRSRRLASYRIEVSSAGAVIAWAQAVAYRTNGWHGAEEDYPPQWRARY
jgi:acyl-CoA thioesterase